MLTYVRPVEIKAEKHDGGPEHDAPIDSSYQ
jgi:hypothetical protein